MTDQHRAYEIVVFGATGFTGRLVAHYLARRPTAPPLRWAIAGRNADKLAALHAELVAINPACTTVGRIMADSADRSSLEAMTAQSAVVLTTVGPYAQYGLPLVQACIATQTAYADITGEPAFVQRLLDEYDTSARAAGVRIVNCCGFDSVPHDLGAYFTVRQLPAGQALTVEGFVSGSGSFSGGTWHSAIGALANLRQTLNSTPPRPPATDDRQVRGIRGRVHYASAVNGWAVPLPTIDPQIVLRSARALPVYGPDFRYGHYVRIGRWWTLAGGAVALAGVVALAQLPPTRRLLLRVAQPGDGPDAATRARSHFRVTFVGQSGARRVITEVRGGDPGYDETAKMVAEAALALARDGAALTPVYGVLTTAEVMAEPLLARLQAAGISFNVVSDSG